MISSTDVTNVEVMAALLICEGRCNATTPHSFREKRPVAAGEAFAGYRWIYGCSQCGQFRVWGYEAA